MLQNELDVLLTLEHETSCPTTVTCKSLLIKGQFTEALKSVTVLSEWIKSSQQETRDPFLDLMDSIEDFLQDGGDKARAENQLLVFLIGVCYLKIFFQNNWTGPTVSVPPLFPKYTGDLTDLSVDGETVFTFVNDVQYLRAAKTILVDLENEFTALPTSSIWSARCNFAHQQILLGPSEKLRKSIETGYDKAIYYFKSANSFAQQSELIASLYIEYGLVYNYYKNIIVAKEKFATAMEFSGLELTITGELGRRTKYQTFDTPQLVLLAKSKLEASESLNAQLPDNVENTHEEAVALDAIKFARPVVGVTENLNVIDQAIILALCLNVKNTNPKSGLLYEEMEVYVRRVLQNPNNWMVYSMALLLRSRLEAEKVKTVDRACMQLGVLVDQMNSDLEMKYDVTTRMKYLHVIAYPPVFKLERELGRKWLSIGSVNTALEIFQKYDMWEDIISCFQAKGELKVAEELVTKRLAVSPTADLYCTMGDITNDSKYYEKAWEHSKCKSSRAKRSLGLHAMNNEQWAEAIQHYAQAVAINPQYGSAWFRMGCCALKVHDLNVAQKSFARVVQLHSDDAEAWNNLAAVYLSQNKKPEAFQALKHALQLKNDNWKIWENYIKVAIELRELSDCLRGLTELLAMKENQKVDIKILSTVIKYVLEDIDNGATDFESLLFRQLSEFMLNVSMKISDDPEMWDLYSKYWLAIGNIENSIMYRQMQCRSLQKNGWEHHEAMFIALVKALDHYTKVHLISTSANRLHSAKLYLNSIVKKADDSFGGTEPHNQVKAMLKSVTELEDSLKNQAT